MSLCVSTTVDADISVSDDEIIAHLKRDPGLLKRIFAEFSTPTVTGEVMARREAEALDNRLEAEAKAAGLIK